MIRRIKYIFLVLMINAGCGTTNIVVLRSDVDIYINGIRHGRGRAEITRTGPPRKIEIQGMYKDRCVARIVSRRQVKWFSVLLGLYTYGIAFFFTWQFPAEIFVPVDMFGENQPATSELPNQWEIAPGEWRR